MKALLHREVELRLAPETQHAYGLPMCDGVELTRQIQLIVVREAGLPDEAIEWLRAAPELYKDHPDMASISHYRKYNRSREGAELLPGMPAPNCRLVLLDEPGSNSSSNFNASQDTHLHDLFRADRPTVLISGSLT
jgi:hypothetical protein